MNKFILCALVASVAFAAAGAGAIPPTQPAGRGAKVAAHSNIAVGAGTNSQTQSNGRDAKVAANNNVAVGAGKISQTQPAGRDSKMPPSKTNPTQQIQQNGQIEKNQAKGNSIKKEPVQPMISNIQNNSPAKNKSEENSLRHYWYHKMDLEQKTNCYQMYDHHESPADYVISDRDWRSLPKVERIAVIRSIWADLRQKTKACAFHMYEEEANMEKAKKAEEKMKALEEKRKKLFGSNNKQGAVKADVYGVATKEEAVRLRHHWYSLDLDEKTKCYEMYEHNEHPTRKEYMEWKSVDQAERKNEIQKLWPTLEDDMKSCVIHIADEETKMGEQMVY